VVAAAVAVAAVAEVAVSEAAVAADAVESGGVQAAAHPGVPAAGARSKASASIDRCNDHGRVRQGRPGLTFFLRGGPGRV
jgi:hypothetical protein